MAIRFDFNNMFEHNIGPRHGVTARELVSMRPAAKKAYDHLKQIYNDDISRVNLSLEWMKLPLQSKHEISAVQKYADHIAKSYDNVISLGIGGSYLGLKAAQDALGSPYYNDFAAVRKGRARIYFEGNNLDPDTLAVLLKNLNPKKTFVIVISKSGETVETKAAFALVERWLKKGVGPRYGRQIFAITDPKSGTLRAKVNTAQAADVQSFKNSPLMKGVGGRYSEFNMGLLHLGIMGIRIQDALDGARAMLERCMLSDMTKNPALMYAVLQTVLYRKKGKRIGILMPFAETLKSTADWYVQLLAESTGKKYARAIRTAPDGSELWEADTKKIVNAGRTPMATRGTNDLHSLQQNNIEGENDKTVTFIRVEKFLHELALTGTNDFLEGKKYSTLIGLAQEATEWALVQEERPNCTIVLSEISPKTWGALLTFLEMATAFEGELLNVNAYDQPGVEGYKNYMYYKLHKPGLAKSIAADIQKNPLKKQARFII